MFTEPDSIGQYVYPDSLENSVIADYEAAAETLSPGYFDKVFRRWGGRPLAGQLAQVWCILSMEFGAAADETEKAYIVQQARNFLDRLTALALPADMHPAAHTYWEAAQTEARGVDDVWRWINSASPTAKSEVQQITDGKLEPVYGITVKKPEDFFSFDGVRAALEEAMRDFAAGIQNVPLLISSLPGHGKTQMVMSYSLAQKDLTLVLPPPFYLEKDLSALFAELKCYSGNKFVVFFDDINPGEINWFEFRNRVGGVYMPPENVQLCISSNYDFPPGILSRGRGIKFPVFDENRCLEMVEDFLKHFGMRKPSANLISLIATSYTEEFGQKKFPELSPRTLSRFLTTFMKIPGKRKQLLEMSEGELITRPDAQLFYEFNIKIMRELYGEQYIETLKQEKLRELSGR